MANHFWRDGGTRKIYLDGVDGLYDELRLVVRTTTNAQIEASDDEISGMIGAKVDARRRAQARFIVSQIIKWDAQDGDDEAPITVDNLRCLQPQLYKRVCNVVYGVDGGDTDPESEKPHREDTASVVETEKN